MKPNTYLSSEQTKQQLARALKELMQEKPFDRITIRDLTERCSIRRQTFYYHFQDIYDLLCWIFQQEFLPLLQNQEGPRLWQNGLLQLFHYLDDNRSICRNALRAEGRPYLKRFFESEVNNIIHNAVEQIGTDAGILHTIATEKDVQRMTQFYSISYTAILESWLNGELDYTPEEMVAFADQMIQDHIRGARARAAQAQNH